MTFLVRADAVRGADFEGYWRYLESVRHALPDHVFRFAIDPRHYDLTSGESLHDAWLDSVAIQEETSGDRREMRLAAIDIGLLGPFHDRRIHLRYRGVRAYHFEMPEDASARYTHTAHGDLLMHEVRLGLQGGLIHELQFERRGTWRIECDDFMHEQEMLPGSPAV